MEEWYPEIIEKYYPLIEPYVKDENVVFRFTGTFFKMGFSSTLLSGLYVVTDKTIYFCGKAKGGSWASIGKSGKIQVIPIDSIYLVNNKKNTFTIKYGLDWMGEKYAGKASKFQMQMHQGKRKTEKGKEKESKLDTFARAGQLKEYIDSKRGSTE